MSNLSVNINQITTYTGQDNLFSAFEFTAPAKISAQPTNDEFVKTKKSRNKKVLVGLGIAITAILTGIVALRRLEAKFFKQQFAMDEVIPTIKDKAKFLSLKTKKGINLDAWDINPQDSKKYVVFCNGFGNNKQQSWLQEIYLKLADSEYGVIAFDYLGRGKSGGEFSQKGTYQSIDTIFDYLKSKGIKQENIGLLGHSLGCSAATNFAKENEHAFIVMINPFSKLKDLIKNHTQRLDAPNFVKSALEKIPSWMVPIKNTFNNEKALKAINKPSLIITSTDDCEIPVTLARKLYQSVKSKSNVLFKEFEHGGHGITDEKITALLDFIRRK